MPSDTKIEHCWHACARSLGGCGKDFAHPILSASVSAPDRFKLLCLGCALEQAAQIKTSDKDGWRCHLEVAPQGSTSMEREGRAEPVARSEAGRWQEDSSENGWTSRVVLDRETFSLACEKEDLESEMRALQGGLE